MPHNQAPMLEPEQYDMPPSFETAARPYRVESGAIRHELEQGESAFVGAAPDESIYAEDYAARLYGIKTSVPAEVELGGMKMAVLDLRRFPRQQDGFRHVPMLDGKVNRYGADMMIIQPDVWRDERGLGGFLGIRQGGPLVNIGKEDPKSQERLKMGDGVGDNHAAISLDGDRLKIDDQASGRPVRINAANYGAVRADRSRVGVLRLQSNPRYEGPNQWFPYGTLDKRPIIGSKSLQLEGGVYIGGGSREAIVVDSREHPAIEVNYQQFMREQTKQGVMGRMIKGVKEPALEERLASVKDFVAEKMRYDATAVAEITRGFKDDQPINLGEFIDRGVGVCRQQGLFAGTILERLVRDGHLDGAIKVERNTVEEPVGAGGTHGWATFTDRKTGVEYVIDPAQGFVGTKQEAIAQGKWNYYIPVQ